MAEDFHVAAMALHRELCGKIATRVKHPVRNRDDLALLYTPGVAAPARAIADDSEEVWTMTGRGNTVAIVTDGSAVLGLGNIGPEAALPVMEGKAQLLKEFADIDAVPLCIRARSAEEIVAAVRALAPSFGGILLEDIAAPQCFAIEEELRNTLSIPVFHDDQHGTAVVVLAALMNALVARMSRSDMPPEHAALKIVISGAGAAGTAIAKMLLREGFQNILVVDRRGILSVKRSDLHSAKRELAAATNPEKKEGTLTDALQGADVLIGVSAPNLVTEAMVRSMRRDAIVFALANPTPEILPDAAKRAGAAIVATGRSDFPNQVNNLLAFPGIFRGTLDGRAPRITQAMERAAAMTLAGMVPVPAPEKILPDPLDRNVAGTIAEAVRLAARDNERT